MASLTDGSVASYVEAEFHCARCGAEAARAAFVPKGAPNPYSTTPALFGGPVLVIWTPQGRGVTMGADGMTEHVLELVAALDRADPAALFALDREYAPFWCPRCAAVYCSEHYRTWDVFDPDLPTWFEETRGLCVEGHERMIFD